MFLPGLGINSMEKCVICNSKTSESLSAITEKSLQTIYKFSNDWAAIGEFRDTLSRAKALLPLFPCNDVHSYHRKCYQNLCNKFKLQRAQHKYEKTIDPGSETRRRSRSSLCADFDSPPIKTRVVFDDKKCVFCQNDTYEVAEMDLHEVVTPVMGQKFLDFKIHSNDVNVRARLALLFEAIDAFSQNMKYHTNCLRKETRNIENISKFRPEDENFENIFKAICDIEIVNIAKCHLNLINNRLDMNQLQNTYISLLEENNVEFEEGTNFKPRIKSKLMEKIPGIEFVKRGPKPELVLSNKTKASIVNDFHENSCESEFDKLFLAAKILRKELESTKEWRFTGSFDDFETPKKLQQFLKWVIGGALTDLNAVRSKKISKTILQKLLLNMLLARIVQIGKLCILHVSIIPLEKAGKLP